MVTSLTTWTRVRRTWNRRSTDSDRRQTIKGFNSIVVFWILVYIFTGWLGVYALDTPSDVSGKGHGKIKADFGARMERRIEHGMSPMDQWIDEISGQ